MSKSDDEVCLSVNSETDVMQVGQQSGDERSPSPILDLRGPEKRIRRESEENEDDEFIVIRRNAKRLNRSNSKNKESEHSLDKEIEQNGRTEHTEEKYEICMTSKEVLPKQMGLAKLLRNANIGGIIEVKYKNPYKVILQFNKEQEAEKLCTKMNSLGYRCQSTLQISLSYGIVKNVDLGVEEEELKKEFKSDYEIISVKRMKRYSEDKWVDSETVRLCFKGSILPSHVYSYGCRFKVEPYVFPVTQCSGCWRFGHLIRQCPSKKIICPKCGGQHNNCETTQYYCINCKGEHMALNKNCPVFLKEKQIRILMSQRNCTYKKALDIYLQKNNKNNMTPTTSYNPTALNNTQKTISESLRIEPSYRDIVLTNNREEDENNKKKDQEERATVVRSKSGKRSNKSNKTDTRETTNRDTNTHMYVDMSESIQEVEDDHSTTTEKEERRRIHRNRSIFKNIIDIAISTVNWKDKLIVVVKIIIEECKKYLTELFSEMEWFKGLYGIFIDE